MGELHRAMICTARVHNLLYEVAVIDCSYWLSLWTSREPVKCRSPSQDTEKLNSRNLFSISSVNNDQSQA
jgi:hypothetical protein